MVVIPVQPEQTEMLWYILGFKPQIFSHYFKIWEAGGGVFCFRPVLTKQSLKEVHQEGNTAGTQHRTCFLAAIRSPHCMSELYYPAFTYSALDCSCPGRFCLFK